jgi:hypothetical protein
MQGGLANVKVVYLRDLRDNLEAALVKLNGRRPDPRMHTHPTRLLVLRQR